ncbi:DNA-processing protein DprA [Lactococcus petauri]|uniref:DNA-processing protein DprA n=1 Tax=Lactococcus petauri TaxID=1940789 RepID=UPI0013FDCF65|nr:DNA-processing protein DprA [Lactococcus petauri]NHI77376.1 DNA processing protein DprA [Lactococcus petauri]
MYSNIKSELFFLKQFGFSNNLLEMIYVTNSSPIDSIFRYNLSENKLPFTEKDKELSHYPEAYLNFKNEFFNSDEFLQNTSKNNKIFFKFDDSNLTSLIPQSKMPLFMYAKGDETLLSQERKRIAIVGTRKPSEASLFLTKKIVKKHLDLGYIIVSGLAEGIDTASHIATLDSGGKTIAVLPTNFKEIYPKRNKELAQKIAQHGLLLSATGSNENTYKSSFLKRNEYLVYISDIILVTETHLKSGTMNTIRNASMSQKKILYLKQDNPEVNKKIEKFGGSLIDI